MADITHRLGIAASASRVYESLTTIEGLRAWWTNDATGDPAPGGRLEFEFGAPDINIVMEVLTATPDAQVVWRCAGPPAEWVDTTITFDLEPSGDETVVRFAHAGWREPNEFMAHCTTKWAYFLLGLKAGFEGGKATPFPDDLHISSWG
jgi:uncharacterized protein YndB with AHSA1/START domain